MQTIEQAGGLVIGPTYEFVVITNQIQRHTFPKGTCEPGESFADTASREIREETGITDFTLSDELGVIERPGFTVDNAVTPSRLKRIHMFACVTAQLVLAPQAPDATAARWVAPTALKEALTWEEEYVFFSKHATAVIAFALGVYEARLLRPE